VDGQRFDELARILGVSLNRKRFLAFLAGVAAPLAAGRALDDVDAKNGKKQRHTKKNKTARRGKAHAPQDADRPVSAQGGDSVCDAFCSGDAPNPQFCGAFGNCGSDADCIAQNPDRPICCTALPGCGGTGEGACCSAVACAGTCTKDSDCPPACVCDEAAGQCRTVTCGGPCFKESDCDPLAGCTCVFPSRSGSVGVEQQLGQCILGTCGGTCIKDSDCSNRAEGCLCDIDPTTGDGLCVTVSCAGACSKDADCPTLDGCFCASGTCQTICAGRCLKTSDCADLPNCVCNLPPGGPVAGAGILPGSCGAPNICPGVCDNNAQCTQQGADSCVCFLGAGVNVADVSSEGSNGLCGECHTLNHVCNASTECCGQLVCLNGTCQRKPTPPASGRRARRCNKHGKSCHADHDCCAQGVCYHGKCGEKDTHCDTDGECARGYSCVGGDLTGSHKRCRKNGRRRKNKRGKHRK
jgi:hypothetical protein